MTISRTASRAHSGSGSPQRADAFAVEVRGLWKTFGEGPLSVAAVENASLTAKVGEFVSIIGPSGCGKSTLFNVISGLERADRGDILLHGERMEGQTGVVGYMPQRDLLLPWRSILNNVILGVELRRGDKEAAKAEARDLFPLFGLNGFEDRYPSELSGGMRQRAALLRTVLTGHDVLLLDEPFGALDALTRSAMHEWLLKVWRQFGMTVLFITHDVDEAVFLADRSYVMTRRPGGIKVEVEITLPRPRNRRITVDPDFVRCKQTLLEALLEETTEPVPGEFDEGHQVAHPNI